MLDGLLGNYLTPEQRALVLAAAREFDAAGLDFVLVAGKNGDGAAAVMANICASCAAGMLAGVQAGLAASGAGVNMGAPLQ